MHYTHAVGDPRGTKIGSGCDTERDHTRPRGAPAELTMAAGSHGQQRWRAAFMRRIARVCRVDGIALHHLCHLHVHVRVVMLDG